MCRPLSVRMFNLITFLRISIECTVRRVRRLNFGPCQSIGLQLPFDMKLTFTFLVYIVQNMAFYKILMPII
jgi:hypothetical protein